MPFFSVIIPTYNRAEELKRSIGSVLAQTFPDFEVLVVDDGSTDGTREVAASFGDKRVRYIFQQNSERSAARNNGIRNATGLYCTLLDSDDVYYPEHLEVLHEAIERDGNPVAVYKTMMHYADKSRPGDLSYAYRGNDTESAMRYVWANGSQLISICFHNEIGKAILFPERFFWFEDIHWLMSVVMAYPLRQVMAHTTLYINKNTAHMLKGNFEKYLDNCVACIRDLEERDGSRIKQVLGNKCFDAKVAELYLGFVVGGAIKNGQISLAKTYLRKAMSTCLTPRLLLKYSYYYLKILKAS